MSNLLIVESENDKYFIEALINYMNIDINISEPICSIDEYKCLGGISHLNNKLYEIHRRVKKDNINKIGIIVDADNKGVEERVQEIQNEVKSIFTKDDKVKISIYITNINGYGELETVLKEIKKEKSVYADCLYAWQKCLPKDKKIKQKDFDKFWVQIYQRYDCCSKKEAKQAHKKCNNEISLKEKDIWDFEHIVLNDLKQFLKELGE